MAEGGGNSWPERGIPLAEARKKRPKERRAGRTNIYPADSDADIVEGLVEAGGDTWRYIGETACWMEFTGAKWEEDTGAHIREVIKAVLFEAAGEAPNERDAQALLADRKISAVEHMARSHARFRAKVEQWDADKLLLNTPGGTIDLRTGKCREHRADDYLSRMTAVPMDAKADHPLWTSVIGTALPDGNERAFLQRFAGYCLTGETTQHALLVAYGPGANSKGVIFNAIRQIMGDYATATAAETFLLSKNERHLSELAALQGKRLALASEIEEGAFWDTMRINRITGGDPLVARFMRTNLFEFVPQFKLITLTNNMPSVRGVNEALRRRFNILRFGVTIPAEKRDPQLPAKLEKEWPAILRWLVDGAVHFRERGGLHPPESVRLSTASYLENEDELEQWLEECVVRDPNAFTKTTDLFESWQAWAKRAHAYQGNQKGFKQKMEQGKGFLYGRNKTKTLRGFWGLYIKTPLPLDDDE